MTLIPGKFITLEGGEGLGKSTNILFLKTYLEQCNIRTVITREPGGTQLAEKIRQLLLEPNSETLSEQTELLLMFAGRSQHIKHVIQPALTQGQWVLCDRFTDATYAYQGGGRGIDSNTIAWLEQWVQNDLRPDLTLLLDAPIEIGMARAAQRAGIVDRFEREKMSFFDNVRRNYLSRAACEPNRIKRIDADQPLEHVQRAIVAVIDNLRSL